MSNTSVTLLQNSCSMHLKTPKMSWKTFSFFTNVLTVQGTTTRVTFGLNVRLDLSGKATTKSLSSLGAELVLKILGESTGAMTIWVIRGDEGVGDIPGVRGGSGESERDSAQCSSIDTRTQT